MKKVLSWRILLGIFIVSWFIGFLFKDTTNETLNILTGASSLVGLICLLLSFVAMYQAYKARKAIKQ